jgi:type II secretory ATPase GspE/PulE/Tfp pilus assembly ATPase PilB-like protein
VRMAERKKLGEMLMEAGFIDNVQLQSALAHQVQWGMRLGSALIEMKFISERDLASFLEQQLNTQCVAIMTKELGPDVINAIDADLAKKYAIFPLDVKDKTLVVATADPLDLQMLDELGFRIGMRITPKLALESEINRAIRYYYNNIRDEIPVHEMPAKPVVDEIKMIVEHEVQPFDVKTDTKSTITTKTVVDALIAVLEDKGILRRSDIFKEIKKKNRP